MPGDEFRAAVLGVVGRLRPGEVASYGDVAAEAGYPGAARAAGAVLARAGDSGVPWWRVVYADGRLAPGHERTQATRLRAEGVSIDGDRIRLPRNATATEGAGKVRHHNSSSMSPSRPERGSARPVT